MTLRLLLMATLACSCSGEPLLPVLEMMDLAEEHSFAEAAADEAQLELVRLSAELETARAGGARRADELADLQSEVAAAQKRAAEAKERARDSALALEDARRRASEELGLAGAAAGSIVPGARAVIPLGIALLLWGAATVGSARGARKAARQKGMPDATGPP